MDRGDGSLYRVVTEYGTYSNLHSKLELVSFGGQLAEERLVLADRLAFVIEDGPAAADPAWINDWT
jgi:hypothetical protein